MASEIIVYHVGGGDADIGPISQVRKAGFALKVITFEALDGTCIADKDGEEDFYVNTSPLSSGLLPPNPRYMGETAKTMASTWGANTELERKIRVKTTTIDELAKARPQPDVLSLDVQGAELRALRGASQTLKNVLCVVAEVEFAPIYQGQPLFHDQAAFLDPYGFRLMDLFFVQAWHQGPQFGLGFLTVAEAAWLRFDYENLTPSQVETLAKIAAGFGRMSYALVLLHHLKGEVSDPWLKSLWEFRDNQELRNIAMPKEDFAY